MRLTVSPCGEKLHFVWYLHRYGGPCPYKYRHIKQRIDCKTAAKSMPGKLWGGEANALNKIDGCFEDEGVIFHNIAGIYRLQKVVNSTIPVGLRVCFRQEHYPTGAGSFTFGTPGKILNLTTQTGLLVPMHLKVVLLWRGIQRFSFKYLTT